MPPLPPISSYDVPRLREYFLQNVKKPFWRLGEISVDGKVGLGPLSIGVKVPGVSGWARKGLIRYATWLWLEPKEIPQETDLDVKALQGALKADGADFVLGILDGCVRIANEHPPLSLWAMRRRALAELAMVRIPPPDEKLRNTEFTLERGILEVWNFLHRGEREAALSGIRKMTERALFAAAQSVTDVLGREGKYAVSGSLMIRIQTGAGISVRLPAGSGERRNAERADWIWGNVTHDGALFLIAESQQPSKYGGFWVPIATGVKGEHLAGATAAFTNKVGSAVFKHDLPPLNGFDPAMAQRWAHHMEDEFKDDLFVSLPFVIYIEENRSDSVAVLNVNVISHSQPKGGWERAYHLKWLELARDRAAPFIRSAFTLYQIFESAHPVPFPLQLGDTAAETVALPPGPDLARGLLPPSPGWPQLGS